MATYRNYIRQSPGFDFASPETASYTQDRYVWTTPDTALVGRWSPASLGRQSVVSLVRVMLDAPGTVSVLTDTGQLRFAVPADPPQFLFLGPEDQVAILAPAATNAELLVSDLTDEDLLVFLSGASGGAFSGGLNYTQVVPAILWVIVHNFGYLPIVQVRDNAGQIVNVDITSDATTTVVGPFDAATAGSARLI